MLGSKIRVESNEGQGSVFYFTIPYIDDEEAERKNSVEISNHKTKATDQIQSLKILIAEDDETSVFLLTMALKDFIGKAINVKTGVEAVEACWGNPDIDLVLMDINMPLMDGYEATRQIRKFNKNLIIIAQTAYGMIDDKKKAIDAGCSDYIAKPLNIALLIEMIVKHLKTK
jgi:CheY-like chemotaxis protein